MLAHAHIRAQSVGLSYMQAGCIIITAPECLQMHYSSLWERKAHAAAAAAALSE